MAIDFQKILSTVGGIVHKGAEIANKVAGLLKDPMGSAMKAIGPFVTKVANKLPFGLGKVVGPFVQKFLPKAMDWLSKGPLAGLLSLVKKIQPTAQKLAGFVTSLDKLLAGGFKNLLGPAKENAQKVMAYAQAQGLLAAEKGKPAAQETAAAKDAFETAPAAKTETPAGPPPDLAAPEYTAEDAAAAQQTETPAATEEAAPAKAKDDASGTDAAKKEEEEEFVPLTDEQLEAEIAEFAPEREKISAAQIDKEYEEAFGG